MKSPQDTHVLIVEDDYLAGEMIQEMIKEIGYTVVGKAMDGKQAVDMAAQLMDTAAKPDVILMDIEMPEMDGLQATRLIQERCPTPVVILTAYETPELIQLAGTVGAGAYLLKPPSLSEIDRAITISLARFKDMMELRHLNTELNSRNQELHTALTQIKTLRGLLPICAGCKKIRDDSGYWHDVEIYIHTHTEAELSHGLCPDCAKKLFPEYYQDKG
jgi:AmiR/NasT family two-component response regulator